MVIYADSIKWRGGGSEIQQDTKYPSKLIKSGAKIGIVTHWNKTN